MPEAGERFRQDLVNMSRRFIAQPLQHGTPVESEMSSQLSNQRIVSENHFGVFVVAVSCVCRSLRCRTLRRACSKYSAASEKSVAICFGSAGPVRISAAACSKFWPNWEERMGRSLEMFGLRGQERLPIARLRQSAAAEKRRERVPADRLSRSLATTHSTKDRPRDDETFSADSRFGGLGVDGSSSDPCV